VVNRLELIAQRDGVGREQTFPAAVELAQRPLEPPLEIPAIPHLAGAHQVTD